MGNSLSAILREIISINLIRQLFCALVQSGQITRSGTCTGSGKVVPDLVKFSFVLPFIVFGDFIKFLEINSFSNIY